MAYMIIEPYCCPMVYFGTVMKRRMHAKLMLIYEKQMSQMELYQGCQEIDGSRKRRQAPGEGKQGERRKKTHKY